MCKIKDTVCVGESGHQCLFTGKVESIRFFENGQFSRHLIFDKKKFCRRKNFIYPHTQELCFFEKKKHFPFFEKKCFFWNISSKKFLTNFLWAEKFWKFWKKIFETTLIFQKKHFFSKKGTCFFFKKNKVLVYRDKKKIFLPKKNVFCQKLSVC